MQIHFLPCLILFLFFAPYIQTWDILGRTKGNKSFMSTSKVLMVPLDESTVNYLNIYPAVFWRSGVKTALVTCWQPLQTTTELLQTGPALIISWPWSVSRPSPTEWITTLFLTSWGRNSPPPPLTHHHTPTIPTECLRLQWERKGSSLWWGYSHPSQWRRKRRLHSNSPT